MRILTLNETGLVAGGMRLDHSGGMGAPTANLQQAAGGNDGGDGYSGGGYFSGGSDSFDWSSMGGGSSDGFLDMYGMGNEAGSSITFDISDPANFYSSDNVVTLQSITVNATTTPVFGDHLTPCDFVAGTAGGAVGGRIGTVLGGVVGGLIGSIGDFFGPEVGIPTTLKGIQWGAIGGAAIGSYFGARYATNGAHLCM